MATNAERLFRDFYKCINDGDVDAALDLCDSRVEVYQSPQVASVIAPQGQEEVAKYLRSWLATWDYYRTEPEEFIETGDQVVAFVRLRARGRGSRFDIEEDVADVFMVKDDKIAQLRLYVDREKALESTGVEP